jgi:MFS family permease
MTAEGTQAVTESSAVTLQQLRRAAVASTVGTSIEWFDFFLYGSASALIFGHLFFPRSDPLTGLLLAFGTLFVGFAARPLGAAIFGHYGDRIGRKSCLIASLLLMGIGTFAVGLIPTYESIGPFSGILLVVLRTVQGIGVGGEWGGAVLLTMEWGARTRRRGFLTSWPQLGVPIGTILSNGALLLAVAASGGGFMTWGWRVPFLSSIVLVGVGLYIRIGILESPTFAALVAEKRVASAPVSEALRSHWRQVIWTCLLRTGQQAPAFIFLTFFLSYATGRVHLTQQEALNYVTIGSAFSIITMPLAGHMSDRYGRRPVVLVGAIGTALWAFAYFRLIDTAVPLLIGAAVVIALFFHDVQYGPQGAFVAEAFPTRLRYSGASLGYHAASVTAGGPAPFLAAWLLAYFGTPVSIAVFIALTALISVISATRLPDRGKMAVVD